MAIIDKQVYKLNIYDNKVGNALYKCSEDEKYCRAMIKHLVFFDNAQVLDLHAKSLSRKDAVYDIASLKPLSFHSENEDVARVIPLDRHWLAVFFKDKKTGNFIEGKAMYVSHDGEGYISDEIAPALNGYVPEEVYLKNLEVNPISYASLHDKYFDGTHDEFLGVFFAKARQVVTKYIVDIVKGLGDKVQDSMLFGKENISLEDIQETIKIEFAKKVKSDNFETYQLLDMIYSFFHGDKIIALSNQYSVNQSENNKESEKQ